MRISARTLISRILLISGAVLIATALVYEAVNYPWQILFQSAEALQVDSLPDPTLPDLKDIEVILKEFEEEDPYADPSDPAQTPSSEPEETSSPDNLPGQEDNLAAGIVSTPAVTRPMVVLGAVKIPKLNVSVNLLEGSSQVELLYGAGHVTGSPQMGGRGNVVVSGHRVTARMHPFRHLDKMEAGDVVILKNDEHTYTYETLETFIIGNKETWVMQRVEGLTYGLTLITCHPVGSARQRLILRAQLKDIDGLTPEEFFAPPSPEQSPADGEGEASPEVSETDDAPAETTDGEQDMTDDSADTAEETEQAQTT